ncbi:MAG TPA: transglycosylase domain-containing protein [Candidatus Saccharimonadales bacterium]|nr:transglycosylase domain-containing protein [Candidatus Saccharimonadales bacterium]
MRTALARHQRRRRNGTDSRRGVRGTASKVAIAFPLFLFGTFVLLGLLGFVAAVGAYGYYSRGLPDPKNLFDNLSFDQQTVVYDSTGKVELARFGQQKRIVLTYDQIPPVLIDATTSVEDKTFWTNAGFDPSAVISAGIDTLTGQPRGASTITQQLVRARLLPQSVLTGSPYERKIREIIQSVRLTQEYPGDAGKQQIIATYLNQNFYGNQSYGVAAAAKSYFGVTDLSKLTLAQAAILAAIPQSPGDYDLVRNAIQKTDSKGRTLLVVPPNSAIVQRRNYVLDQMVAHRWLTRPGQPGAITDAQIEAAKNDPVILVPQVVANWRAPHFVWAVRSELATILCPQDPTNCPQIDTGGYTVKTTLNWNMQKVAEKWVKAAVLGPNAPNTATYLKSLGIPDQAWIENLRQNDIHNGALIAIDYRTGHVLAYVGSAQYYSQTATKQFQPQFDVLADGWRQPGSAFKPINYVTGFQDGTLTPATMLMDVTTDFGGGYLPTDADLLERGPVRIREAFQLSLNIPAIKAAVINGPDHVFDMAKKFGLHFQSATNQAGASIAIGTLEIHPADLISAYGAIADGGTLMPRTTIFSITDSSGNQIWPTPGDTPTGTSVVSPQAAYLITNILAGNTDPNINPFWGRAEIMNGSTRRPATLKTGTTNDTKDLMAYGYLAPPADPKAPALAVGVWMGNSDNSPTGGIFSLEAPTPLWQAFLTEVSKGTPIADFQEPPGIVHATVDAYSGLLPGPYTTRTVDEIFIAGTVPKQVDNTKVGIAIDKASGKLWANGCTGPKVTEGFLDLSNVDAGFPSWQKADQGWVARARRGPGVYGGPGKDKTATSYFYETGFEPFGATWGAPFPPTATCTAAPSPSPSPSASASAPPCPPGGVQLNPDGTVLLGPDGQPIACPGASSAPSPSESPIGQPASPPEPTATPPPSAIPPPVPGQTPRPTATQ